MRPESVPLSRCLGSFRGCWGRKALGEQNMHAVSRKRRGAGALSQHGQRLGTGQAGQRTQSGGLGELEEWLSRPRTLDLIPTCVSLGREQ